MPRIPLPDWDTNTTASDAEEYMKKTHKLQSRLFKKTKSNPDPPLAWDSDMVAFGSECVDSDTIQKILKMRYMEFFMEVTTATPDGRFHSQRFEAPRTFFRGEQNYEGVEDNFKIYTDYRGNQRTYNRPKWDTTNASEGALYWSVWIREEEYSAPKYNWQGPAEVRMRKSMRTTIAPYYGKGGFMALANVMNRR